MLWKIIIKNKWRATQKNSVEYTNKKYSRDNKLTNQNKKEINRNEKKILLPFEKFTIYQQNEKTNEKKPNNTHKNNRIINKQVKNISNRKEIIPKNNISNNKTNKTKKLTLIIK